MEMGFYSGRATFARYRVAGRPPRMFTEEHLARLAEHAAGRQRMISSDGVEAGWSAGEHILDTQFDLAKNIINDQLFFCLRIDTVKLPSDLMRAILRDRSRCPGQEQSERPSEHPPET